MNKLESQYLQDKNAGNLGDYLKHFLLLKLISGIIKKYPNSSIAYVESHAGAGCYKLQDIHFRNRNKYRDIVCDNHAEWATFDRLNSAIDKNRLYYGSFVLAGKLLIENKDIKSKLVLYEKELEVYERMISSKDSLLLNCDVKPFKEISSPHSIRNKIVELKNSGFNIVICLVDPYFKHGKEDKAWCEMLFYNEPNCFILTFDAVRSRVIKGKMNFIWHCERELIASKNWGIQGYAIFGNNNAKSQLT